MRRLAHSPAGTERVGVWGDTERGSWGEFEAERRGRWVCLGWLSTMSNRILENLLTPPLTHPWWMGLIVNVTQFLTSNVCLDNDAPFYLQIRGERDPSGGVQFGIWSPVNVWMSMCEVYSSYYALIHVTMTFLFNKSEQKPWLFFF